MPAKSKAQQVTAAIALHGKPKPGSAAAKMKKSMKKTELHKFASTPKKGLPQHVKKKKRVTESVEPMHVQFISPQARAEYMGDGVVEDTLDQLPEGTKLAYVIHDPIEEEHRTGPEKEAIREVYVTPNARVIDRNVTFDGPYELLRLKLNSLSKYFRRHMGEAMSTVTFKDYLVEQAQLNEMGKRFGRKPEGAPRVPEHIRDVMAGRKGGGHHNAKTDFKRAKEKVKFLRDKFASEYEEMCSSEYEEEVDMRLEPGPTDVDIDVSDKINNRKMSSTSPYADSESDNGMGSTDDETVGSWDTDFDEKAAPEFESYDDWKQSARDAGLIVRFDRQNNLCTASTKQGDIMGEFDHNTDDGWLEDEGNEAQFAKPDEEAEFRNKSTVDLDNMNNRGERVSDAEREHEDFDMTAGRIGSGDWDNTRGRELNRFRESFVEYLDNTLTEKEHVGFKGAVEQAKKSIHPTGKYKTKEAAAAAAVASATRGASKAAKKANPRLKKVKG